MRTEEKAARLLELHQGPRILVLPNIWDPFGARLLEIRGYPAVATASAALSASLGFMDGERIARSTLIEHLKRIAGSVTIPVSADIEAGFASSLPDLRETIRQVIQAGIVGVNIEDSLTEGGELRSIEKQQERIRQVRATAAELGIHLCINARTDTFISGTFESNRKRMEACVERAEAYMEAGADCIYPVGPGDRETVTELRARIDHPLNILFSPSAESITDLQDMGVNRVSFGPYLFRSLARKYETILDEVDDKGRSETMWDDIPSAADINRYLRGESE